MKWDTNWGFDIAALCKYFGDRQFWIEGALVGIHEFSAKQK